MKNSTAKRRQHTMAVAAASKTIAHAASEALTNTPAVRKSAWHAIKDMLTNRVVVAAALAVGTLWLGADHAAQAYYARRVYENVRTQVCKTVARAYAGPVPQHPDIHWLLPAPAAATWPH